MSNDGKIWCICQRCSSELLGIPDTSCPGCEKGTLEKHWPEHVSIEDEYPNGTHVLVIRKSRGPISGHYCTVHRIKE